MTCIIPTAALVLSSLVAIPVSGQETNPQADPASQAKDQDRTTPTVPQDSDRRTQYDFRRFIRDEYHMWTSPFRASSYDRHTMKKYGAGFMLISGALIASDKKTADLLPNTEDQARWSGRVSQLGAPYTLAAFSGAVYLLGEGTGDDHAREAGLLGLEAIAHSQLILFGLKQITQRERPLANGERVGFWKGGDSFPSGHAATSFAVATVFAREYRDHIAVPVTAYSIATVVAASRMGARRHWVSDIFVGSSLGFLIGRYVYKHHHDPNLPGSRVRRTSRLTPAFAFGDHRAGLYWVF